MMPQTSQNITAHELIGLKVKVMNALDPHRVEISGVIRDETKNTLIVEAAASLLVVPKKSTEFHFQLPSSETATVNGTRLLHRPEDRVKKGLKW